MLSQSVGKINSQKNRKFPVKKVYCSTFHAYLNYGLEIWGSTFKSHLNKLSLLRNKTVRSICNSKWADHVSIFYKNLEILKLADLFRLELATFMYKANKKTIPMAFQSYLKKVTEVYERTTRAIHARLVNSLCPTTKLRSSRDRLNTKEHYHGTH